MNKIKKFFKSFLVIDLFRYHYGIIRFKILKKIHGIKSLNENKNIINTTIEYNKSAFNNVSIDFYMKRTGWLTFLLMSLEQVNKNSKILIIGPRTENEILRLEGYGYTNVIGADLISYSPKIKLQDMHNMKFKENSFDVVLIGWTISYSNNPKLAIKNIVKILKNNSILIIGLQYMQSFEVNKDAFNKINRINTISQIEKLLDKNLKRIIFQNEAPLKNLNPEEIKKITGLSASNTIGCFEIQK